jgi:hypothetical protein
LINDKIEIDRELLDDVSVKRYTFGCVIFMARFRRRRRGKKCMSVYLSLAVKPSRYILTQIHSDMLYLR